MKAPKTVDGYIKTFPKDVRAILEKVRRTIRKAAPKAEERISYRMPSFKMKRTIAYYAAFKNHIGMYPPAPSVFKKETARYAGPKGNLKFPYDRPVPFGLITKIVKYRVKQDGKKV